MKLNKNYIIQFFLITLLFLINQGVFYQLLGGSLGTDNQINSPDFFALATLSSALVSILFLVINNRKDLFHFVSEMGFTEVGRWYQWLIVGGVFFGYNAVLPFVFNYFELETSNFVDTMKNYQHLPNLIIGIGVFGPVFEELSMRGLLYKGIELKNFWLKGLLVSGVFTILHMQYTWYEALAVFGFAFILYWGRDWSKSLWLPIAIHVINNILAVI